MGSKSQSKDLERRILAFCRDEAAKPVLDKGIKEVVAISEAGIMPEYSEGPNMLEEEVRQTLERNPHNQVAVIADLMDLDSPRGIGLYECLSDLSVTVLLKGDMAGVQDPERKKKLVEYLSPDNQGGRKAKLALVSSYEDIGTMMLDMDVFDVLALPSDPNITLKTGAEQNPVPKELSRIRNVLYITRGKVPKMIELIKKYNLLQSSEEPVIMHFIAGTNSNMLEEGMLPSEIYSYLEKHGPYEAIVIEKNGVSKDGDEVEFSDPHSVARLISGLKASNGIELYLDENAEDAGSAPMGFKLARTEMDIVRELSPYSQKELQRATQKARFTKDEKNIALRKPRMNILKLPLMTFSTGRDEDDGLDIIVEEQEPVSTVEDKTEEVMRIPPPPAQVIPEQKQVEEQPKREYTEQEIQKRLWSKYSTEKYRDLKAGKALVHEILHKFNIHGALRKNYFEVIEVISRDETEMPSSREGFADLLTDVATLVRMYHEEWEDVGGFMKSALESNAEGRYRSFKKLATLCAEDSTGTPIVDDKLKPLITGMLSSLAVDRTERAVDDLIEVLSLSEYIHPMNERMLFLTNLGAYYRNEPESRRDPVAFAEDLLKEGKFWTVSDEPVSQEPAVPEPLEEAPKVNGAPVMLDTPKGGDYQSAAEAAQAEIQEIRTNGKKKPPRPSPSRKPAAGQEAPVPTYVKTEDAIVDDAVPVMRPVQQPVEESTLEAELFSDEESEGRKWDDQMKKSMGLPIQESIQKELIDISSRGVAETGQMEVPYDDAADSGSIFDGNIPESVITSEYAGPEKYEFDVDDAVTFAIMIEEQGQKAEEEKAVPVQMGESTTADEIRDMYSLDALASRIDGEDGRFEARVASLLGPKEEKPAPQPEPEPAPSEAYAEEPVKVEEIDSAEVEEIVEEIDLSEPEPEEEPVAQMQLDLLEAGAGNADVDAHPYDTKEAAKEVAEEVEPEKESPAKDDYEKTEKPIGGIEMEDEKKEAPKSRGLGWLAVPALIAGLVVGAAGGLKYKGDADTAALKQYNNAVVEQVMAGKARVNASAVLKKQTDEYVEDQTEGFFGVDQLSREGLESKLHVLEELAGLIEKEVDGRKNICANKGVRFQVLEQLYAQNLDVEYGHRDAILVGQPAVSERLNLMDVYLHAVGLKNVHGNDITPAEFVAMSNDDLKDGLVAYAMRTSGQQDKPVVATKGKKPDAQELTSKKSEGYAHITVHEPAKPKNRYGKRRVRKSAILDLSDQDSSIGKGYR